MDVQMAAQNNLVFMFMPSSQAQKAFLTPDIFHPFTVHLTSTLDCFPSDAHFADGQQHPATSLFAPTTNLGHFFTFLLIINSHNHHPEGITGQSLMFNYLIQFKDKSDHLLNT